MYSVALGHQRQGDTAKAVMTFKELLQHDFVKDVSEGLGRYVISGEQGMSVCWYILSNLLIKTTPCKSM